MELRSYRVLSFDCYGTLVDWDAGLAASLKRIAPEMSDDELLAAYAPHEARIEHDDPTRLYRDVVTAAATAMAAELGRELSAADAVGMGEAVGDWPLFPDSAAAMAQLHRHCQLVVLSNVDRQSFAGSSAKLGDPFDGILLAEDIGSYKPSPRNFEALLAWLDEHGINRGEHLHVAQSLFHDHVPAKAFGMATVWINRRHNREGEGASGPVLDVTPDWEFPDMQSFADAMEASVAAGE